MKTISSSPALAKYIKEFDMGNIIDLSAVHPVLCIYSRGELLSGPHIRQQYISFVASGKVQIYGIDQEGRKIPVNLVSKGALIGDVEFCREDSSSLISEAATDVTCVGIPTARNRKILEEDNRFLRFLLRSMASKVYLTGVEDEPVISVEKKLLHYLRTECPDHCLNGVEHASLRLRCSRRQLQRVLGELCDEGVIEKVKKGSYRLTDYR